MNLFQVTKKQEGGGLALQTFTGNPVTFTPSYSEELPAPFNGTNLKVNITASGGNGTPSTPIPIVGYSEVNLTRCGKNFWNVGVQEGYIYNGRYYPSSSYWCTAANIPIFPNTTYTLQGASASDGQICFYDSDGVFIPNSAISARIGTFTTPNDAYFISVYNANSTLNEPKQLELGSQATDFEPYNGQTFTVAFGQTVYGGVYDAKAGKVTITHRKQLLSDMEWVYRGGFFRTLSIASEVKKPEAQDTLTDSKCEIFTNVTWHDVGDNDNEYAILGPTGGELIIKCSSCSDLTAWAALINGYSLVYPLATPIEIDVSAISVEAVSGVNNIISNGGGDIEVQCLI